MTKLTIAALALGLALAQQQPAPPPPAAGETKPVPPSSKPKKAPKKKKKKPADPVQDAASQIPKQEAPELKQLTAAEKKLDQGLIEWVRAYKKDGETGAKDYAAKHAMALEEGGMGVKILGNFDPASAAARMPALAAKVKELGGTVRTSFENSVFVVIPVKAVAQLAELDDVWSMSLELPTNQPLKPER
jgi:hypothetical protein